MFFFSRRENKLGLKPYFFSFFCYIFHKNVITRARPGCENSGIVSTYVDGYNILMLREQKGEYCENLSILLNSICSRCVSLNAVFIWVVQRCYTCRLRTLIFLMQFHDNGRTINYIFVSFVFFIFGQSCRKGQMIQVGLRV